MVHTATLLLVLLAGAALVLGAGVLPEWLAQPLRVRGLSTRLGRVDWRWDGREVRVTTHGFHAPVRLGPAFPPATRVRVE